MATQHVCWTSQLCSKIQIGPSVGCCLEPAGVQAVVVQPALADVLLSVALWSAAGVVAKKTTCFTRIMLERLHPTCGFRPVPLPRQKPAGGERNTRALIAEEGDGAKRDTSVCKQDTKQSIQNRKKMGDIPIPPHANCGISNCGAASTAPAVCTA